MGSEYARFGVASGLASAIFFYPFSGAAEKRGAEVSRLRVALLRREIPSAVVGDAVRRLEEDLWYLHAEGGLYYFTNQANLNKVILEREEAGLGIVGTVLLILLVLYLLGALHL